MLIDQIGGRKNALGYLFLLCSTFIVWTMKTADYVGISTVIGAMAVGLGTIVWGNVKEHQSNGKTELINNNKEIKGG